MKFVVSSTKVIVKLNIIFDIIYNMVINQCFCQIFIVVCALSLNMNIKSKLFCIVQIATLSKKYTSPSILRHCVLGREVSRNLARNVPYLQHQHQAMASQGAREKKVSNVD